jgi:hypothetical protein
LEQDGKNIMNKRIRQLSQEVRSGKQLQENIPQLFNTMADQYQTYASVRLAMHYFSFYETYLDEENTWGVQAKETIARINHIIRENILEGCTGAAREKAISETDKLRKEISKQMNVLTTYTDIFQIYEFVLNRLEYRFMEKLGPVDEVELEKEILRYIFAEEDNLVINEKIREIIGQLPIRITRQKYFDLLQDSLNSYLGADEASLQTYLYMLRTSAMLYHEEGMEECYPELAKRMNQLSKVDYKNITKEAYDQCVSALQVATLMLEIDTTIYFGLQEIVNEVYTMLLCSTYAGMVENDFSIATDTAMIILQEINTAFTHTEKNELNEELIDKFSDMEGVQEELSYELTLLEDALYEVEHTHQELTKSMMLDQLLQILLRSQKLLSNSLFIDLDEVQKEENTVDEALLEAETRALTEELEALFGNQDKIVSRAIMANTLSKMPVFFKDHKEVMDYVRYSIERCSDVYEKAACIEIINEIISD